MRIAHEKGQPWLCCWGEDWEGVGEMIMVAVEDGSLDGCCCKG